MLIQQIMDSDVLSCHHAFEQDMQLKDLDNNLYAMMDKCPAEIYHDLEFAVNKYVSRVIQIAYLQGLKDFAELHITLKEDVLEILQKCE